jgi:hypothetical protein
VVSDPVNTAFERPKRPGSVTLVVVLGALAALSDLTLGVILWLNRSDPRVVASLGKGADQVAGTAIGVIIAGLVIAIVTGWLAAGSALARRAVTLVMLLRIVGAIWMLPSATGQTQVQAIVALVLAVTVTILLGTPRAKSYFDWR